MTTPISGSLTQLNHGYYSDRSYTYEVYPEHLPLRLSLIGLLHGHRPPPLDTPFRLLELGCGQGVGLCVQAALHPDAHFCGIDLLPSHISHARSLAAAASLANTSFLEVDLIELAASSSSPADRPAPSASSSGQPWPLSLSSYDFAICHGVVSWVSPEVEKAIWQVASFYLRPGGLFYLSYNALPGKLHEVPFQHLVGSLQQINSNSSACLTAAIAQLQRLQQAGAGVFDTLPSLASLLQLLPSKNPAYLPHEYSQQHWRPRFADTMIRQAEAHALSYLGSALLPDAFESLLPEAFRDILAAESDTASRQLLHDLLVNQSFRRDVYGRGLDALWPRERAQAIADLQIVRMIDEEQLQGSNPNELFSFPVGFATIQGDGRWFGSLLMALGSEPRRLGDLSQLAGVGPISPSELLQNICLLLEARLVALVAPPVAAEPSIRLNQVLSRKVRSGAPYRAIAAPLIGSALAISDLDFLALDGYLNGLSGPALIRSVDEALDNLGRDLQTRGRPIKDNDRDDVLKSHIASFELHHLPLLRRVGAIP